MVIPVLKFFSALALLLALASCAIPEPAAVADPAAVKMEEPKVVEQETPTEAPLPDLPPMQDDEIRVPPMLNLPTDTELRASNPLLPRSGSTTGGISVRPPTDPPSRVKPGDKPDATPTE